MFKGKFEEATFFITMPLLFRPSRLVYFFEQVRCFAEMNSSLVHLHVVTNTHEVTEKKLIMDLLAPFQSPHFEILIESFWNPSDPKEMTWVHKKFITDIFLKSDHFSHFIYLEDDIRMSRLNLEYFIANRRALGAFGFIPSFVRYEFNFKTLKLYTSDVIATSDLTGRTVRIEDTLYVTADNPYCAAYVLDQELAEEYILTDSFYPERSVLKVDWPSTERSAMGLCFERVPAGHVSRFKVPLGRNGSMPDIKCLVHHLPNNFTNCEWPGGHYQFGKTELLKMFFKE